MEETWLKEKKLISRLNWVKAVDSLKSNQKITDKNLAKKILREKLLSAIQSRVPEEKSRKKYGIFFSGGVDSSFIAAVCNQFNPNFTCYSVGFQDEATKAPEDVQEAQKVARKLGFDLKFRIYNLEETEKIIQKTVKILKPVKKVDVINVGVGAVILAARELARKDKINYFFSGLGSEEIFAGYERHTKAKNVNRECWQGLKQMWDRDLVRDFTLGKELKITVKTPFLDGELIKTAMQIPGEWKINDTEKKIILREIAEEFLDQFAWRKKKAAQYGSCFDKAIGKLAKKHGFEFKKDWLESL